MNTKTLKYVVIDGPIGVGKTTLAKYMAHEFQAAQFLEIVEENPYLVGGFYQDIAANAFNTELFFLLARFRQQREIVRHFSAASQPVISDYLFQKNAIFAGMTLNREDFRIFSTIFEALLREIPTPDLVVYLRADVDTLVRRIRVRDRSFERDIEDDYLKRLSERYDAYFADYSAAPVVTIDAASLDFVQSSQDYRYIVKKIMAQGRLSSSRMIDQPTLQF